VDRILIQVLTRKRRGAERAADRNGTFVEGWLEEKKKKKKGE
jgi:hypothetical protein